MLKGSGIKSSLNQPVYSGGSGIVEAGWLLLVILIPLGFDRFVAFPFDWHKAGLLRTLVAIAFVAWLLGRWRRPLNIKTLPFLYWPLLLLLLLESVSTLFSLSPGVSLWGSLHRGGGLLSTTAFVLLFIMASQGLSDSAARARLVTVLLAVSFPVALYAMMQQGEIDPLYWADNNHKRPASTIGNPIFLAAFLNYAFLLGLARLLQSLSRSDNKHPQYVTPLLLALLLVQLWAIWLTQSRGPVLALLVGLLAFAMLARGTGSLPVRRVLKRLARHFLVLILGLVVAWLLFAVVNLILPTLVLTAVLLVLLVFLIIKLKLTALLPSSLLLAALVLIFSFAFQLRVATVSESFSMEKQTQEILTPLQDTLGRHGTAKERILYWQGYRNAFLSDQAIKQWQPNTTASLVDDPWFALRTWLGYGPEMAGDVVSAFYPAELGARHALNVKIDRAHNSVWDKLINQGVLGLIVWLAFLLALIQLAYQRLNRRVDWRLWILFPLLTVLATRVLGSEFFGLCLQLSLVVTVLIQLLFSRVKPGQKIDWLAGVSLAAILMHLSEGSVGIGVTSTELMFWLCAALIVSASVTTKKTQTRPVAMGAVLAAITGALMFAFLGVDTLLVFDDNASWMLGTPVNLSLTGWLAHISGTAWQMGSIAGLIALYAGIFGLGLITMGVLLSHTEVAEKYSHVHLLKGFLPLLLLAIMGIWLWQGLLAESPVFLTWSDMGSVVSGAQQQAMALSSRVLIFYAWVVSGLLWIGHCLRPPQLAQGLAPPTSPIIARIMALFAAGALLYLLGIRPALANAYVQYGQRWANGDVAQWLRLTGDRQVLLHQVALNMLEQVTRLTPERPQYWVALAEMHSLAGQGKAPGGQEFGCGSDSPVNQALFKAIREHPSDVIVLRGLAILAGHNADISQDEQQQNAWTQCALHYYQQLHRVSPTHPQVLTDTGDFVLRRLQQPLLADALADQALTLNKNTLSAVNIKIKLALQRQKQSCHPVGENEELTGTDEQCRLANAELSKWLQRSLEIKPSHLHNRLLLAELYLLMGQYTEAKPLLIAGMIKHPKNRAVRALVVKLARVLNQSELPLAMIDEALTELPDEIELLIARIELLLIDKDDQLVAQAIKALLGAAEHGGHRNMATAAPYLARIFTRQGEIHAALQQYQQALSASPGNAALWLEVARFAISINDRDTAKLLLNTASARAGNRLQRIQIEQLQQKNFQALNKPLELELSRRRLQQLLMFDVNDNVGNRP